VKRRKETRREKTGKKKGRRGAPTPGLIDSKERRGEKTDRYSLARIEGGDRGKSGHEKVRKGRKKLRILIPAVSATKGKKRKKFDLV